MNERIPHLEKFGCEIVIDEEGDFAHALPKERDYSRIVAITDETVSALYRNKLNFVDEVIVLPVGEKTKTLESAELCWQKMSAYGCDRKTLVIALGGGMITDLAGFVAACYLRGVDMVSIPTTLLAMVDAAIGGKTAVNLSPLKNRVGVISHPKRIWISPGLLDTLPKREYISGLAEVIKYGIIWDAAFFEELEQGNFERMIARSCAIKAEIVAADEKERGVRSILNFGHTFGHAIESLDGFSTHLHGEAVAMGMCLAMKLSHLMGKAGLEDVKRVYALCQKVGLPTEIPDVPVEEWMALIAKDKKNHYGKFTFIVAETIGRAKRVEAVKRDLILKTLSPLTAAI